MNYPYNIYNFVFFRSILCFSLTQSQQGELDSLNQKAQEILREADVNNRNCVEQENTQINRDWKETIHNLKNRVDALAGLAQLWEDYDKRIHTFENQLVRLDERQRNVDQVVRSRRHLEDTKHIVQVSQFQKISNNFLAFSRQTDIKISIPNIKELMN